MNLSLRRVFWFVTETNDLIQRELMPAFLPFFIFLIVGFLAGFFGSIAFALVTFVLAWIAGFFSYQKASPFPFFATLILGGYIIGLVIGSVFHLF